MSSTLSIDKLRTVQKSLWDNLNKVDRMYEAQSKLRVSDLRNWYEQHLLVDTLSHFMIQNEMVLPKHLSRFLICFNNSDVMVNLYNHLMLVTDADSRVLKYGYEQLSIMLRTQGVSFKVVDEVSQWRLIVD